MVFRKTPSSRRKLWNLFVCSRTSKGSSKESQEEEPRLIIFCIGGDTKDNEGRTKEEKFVDTPKLWVVNVLGPTYVQRTWST